ncbi:MerR family transcriptional regulator [Brachybacterium sp. FME24]|uniref:MerR family transcriptional regulator n=1 Tax=Brachybacterium sp. FME24 TaxID=2742605 RepID=UPI00186741C3|nr:MerR family transcriptional regulator [Brachybacterium sp. FME24]
MRIGELAGATGVSARSLRYYESQGLIRSERTGSGWRIFPASTVDRVILIQRLFAAGLCSRVIEPLLPCLEASPPDRTSSLDTLLAREATRLETGVRDLERQLEVLQDLRREIGATAPEPEVPATGAPRACS